MKPLGMSFQSLLLGQGRTMGEVQIFVVLTDVVSRMAERKPASDVSPAEFTKRQIVVHQAYDTESELLYLGKEFRTHHMLAARVTGASCLMRDDTTQIWHGMTVGCVAMQ